MVSRRAFIRNGSLALVSLGFAPSFLARAALAAPPTRRAKRLIAIFQRGAVDGLSVVVPYADADYYRARPTIAIARPRAEPTAALDLDGFFGLNPRLSALKPFWDRQDLAIVHACGSPDATRSHFDAQDYMESGTPGVKATRDGWINRCLQARHNDDESAFRAVSLTSQLPRAMQGRSPALAMSQLSRFTVGHGASSSFESQYASAADQILHGTGRDAFAAMRALKGADPSRHRPEHGADYPRSPFGQALLQIAQLVKADVGLEIAFAEVGGWDTHANQGPVHGVLGSRLDDFSRGIAALATDLGERMSDTVILTMSEFGRAVAENGSRGTDHGHGNAMFVMGGGVRGGMVHGRWPGLAVDRRYQSRDLAITTDFRDVFADIVVHHLGISDLTAVFPGYSLKREQFPGLFA